MTQEWNLNKDGDEGMKAKLAEARKAGHTRLFAIAYDRKSPIQWHSRKNEAEMQQFLDSRDESESTLFNCAIAVVVVNPQDTDETIDFVLNVRSHRRSNQLGYFSESF